ncbi:hypothetical protein N0V95_007020 [Ascochyta clinopodiicola]|nr:hypothetical protein N0V95_007020 [Ascochyta clinopodiicola]
MFEDCRDYAAEEQDQESVETLGSHLATKQSMLRLLTTELLLNTKVYSEFLVLQSDFKWFGPSLPHDTIFAVLVFFGVSEKWLRFFQKFLGAPVVFAEDGPGAKAQVRKCGIPISHVLSDALGETVLFCLDFAINRRTDGANIHRFHDDLWFWGQERTSVQAWEAVKEFTNVMCLELNNDKTGASLIVIDKTKFRALAPTLFEAMPAVTSIITNFAEPANCFDRQHNDMIFETFSNIQRSLFADSGTKNVTEYLRGVLKERFRMDDTVPDGFFYFPMELGGLGLRNPFINAFATYNQSFRNPVSRIERGFEEEREAYEAAKERWDVGNPRRSTAHKPIDQESVLDMDAKAEEPFMGFDEYIMYREESSEPLFNAYVELLDFPPEERVQTSSEVIKALRSSGAATLEASSYLLWIFTLYAGDLKQRFGGQGLQLGERDLLPLGLVELLKSEKVSVFKNHSTTKI